VGDLAAEEAIRYDADDPAARAERCVREPLHRAHPAAAVDQADAAGRSEGPERPGGVTVLAIGRRRRSAEYAEGRRWRPWPDRPILALGHPAGRRA
jgi:hypothetical protein